MSSATAKERGGEITIARPIKRNRVWAVLVCPMYGANFLSLNARSMPALFLKRGSALKWKSELLPHMSVGTDLKVVAVEVTHRIATSMKALDV